MFYMKFANNLYIKTRILNIRIDVIGHPVTEHNHVNEHHGGNANAAIFSHCGRLMQQKCHDRV